MEAAPAQHAPANLTVPVVAVISSQRGLEAKGGPKGVDRASDWTITDVGGVGAGLPGAGEAEAAPGSGGR